MEENYCDIKKITENTYMIGTYQRGYRWDENNVRELLDDIYEGKLIKDFDFESETYLNATKAVIELQQKAKEKAIYCLQPLVIKKTDKGYSVIDGQQRLTTIYIILKVLSEIEIDYVFPETFSISYTSREESTEFLQNILEKTEAIDIDTAYMLNAKRTIKEWFLEKNADLQGILENCNHQKEEKLEYTFGQYVENILLKETKFIWDEIEESSPNYQKSEQKIFADRNTGKLELTDSELIKSLFMNPEYYNIDYKEIKDKQILISEIWDLYENELHKEELWKFIPIEDLYRVEYEKNTRIDAIFYLLVESKGIHNKISENNSLFKAVKNWIDTEIIEGISNHKNKEEVMANCWREVCNVFDGIKELYDDNEMYNLLSVYRMIQENKVIVYQKYKEILKQDRDIRKNSIKIAIREKIFSQGIAKIVKHTKYPNREAIRNIIFAYNIAVTNNSLPINKFDFSAFDVINGKWDVEHIYATNEGYIQKAPMREKIEVLEIFSQKDDNIYKNYLEYLYDTKIEEVAEDLELSILEQEKDLAEEFWNKSIQRYDKYFDFWRYLELKGKASQLLKQCKVKEELEKIINDDRFETKAEEFLQSSEYEDDDVFSLLKIEYLYWDKELDREFERIKQTKELKVNWHGMVEKISSNKEFWKEYNPENDKYKDNFRRYYYRNFLNMIYDNKDILAQDVNLTRHGKKKEKIVNENNKEKFRAFFKGTIYRINETINEFFEKDESINPKETNKGIREEYRTLAAFVNDNSMGNMMLLPSGINRASKYSNENFSGKRKYIAELEENVFLPIGTSNVFMGKFIDLETSTEQWLMKERLNYLKDMIEVMKKYYREEEKG